VDATHERVSRTRLGPNATTPADAHDGYLDLIHFTVSNPVFSCTFLRVSGRDSGLERADRVVLDRLTQNNPQQRRCQVGPFGQRWVASAGMPFGHPALGFRRHAAL
jgi:hypothetical protein